MRLVCTSDTHSRHSRITVPNGDVLIHAGDFSGRGTAAEVADFAQWLRDQPHANKVLIPGNHDFLCEQDPAAARLIFRRQTYLLDQAADVERVRFYGTPWQPRFFDWAFNLDRGAPLKAKWDAIPTDTQVLVVHGPPAGILDRTSRGESVGCADLRRAIDERLPKLRLVVFGHIHEAYGSLKKDGVLYVNASACNLAYQAVQPPIVVELDGDNAEVWQ